MNKKIFILLVASSFLMASSCKQSATSKIDKNAIDVVKNEEFIDPEPNIGGPPMPVSTPTPVPVNGKYPVLTFEKKEFDFGTINQGDKVHTDFIFTNTGDADLLITSAVGSCGCTIPEYPKEPIKPGQSSKMKVSFNSEGKTGQQIKTVTVTSNTASGKETISIKASILTKPAATGVTNQ